MTGCDDIRERLLAHHEGELATEERLQVEAHLATCVDCTREAGLIREALGRVQALPVPEPPAGFWGDFEAAVRRRIAAVPPPRPAAWARVAAWLGRVPGLQRRSWGCCWSLAWCAPTGRRATCRRSRP
ncbi:MAG: zf-HC2 domain-containing protein [candidate division NC10 bacterium]|nr:zf-HC2 domain-containing protein [candidate division NC10 bacterium]